MGYFVVIHLKRDSVKCYQSACFLEAVNFYLIEELKLSLLSIFLGTKFYRLYVDGRTHHSGSNCRDGQQIRSELELHHHHV